MQLVHRDGSNAFVVAVASSPTHTLRKPTRNSIVLLEGLGVEGDAHMGRTVRHRSRVARDPTQPNHRQVHLIHAEIHAELRAAGFAVEAGVMGENVTTRGLARRGATARRRVMPPGCSSVRHTLFTW
jgi:MOSC domain-containing protein YiiM